MKANNNKVVVKASEANKDKKVLVTGGTDGIGRETALRLAELGYNVTISGRSAEKASEVQNAGMEAKMPPIMYYQVDFADFNEVVEFAKFVVGEKFDIVVFNAGVMLPEGEQTNDEIDTTIQINFLSTYYVTKKLLDAAVPVHMVFLTSILIRAVSLLSMGKFSSTSVTSWETMCSVGSKSGWTKYAISKYGMAVLASMVTSSAIPGITATAIHPGSVMTNLTHNISNSRRRNLRVFKFMLTSVEKAGDNVLQACMKPLEHNQYFVENKVKKFNSRITSKQAHTAMSGYADHTIARLAGLAVNQE